MRFPGATRHEDAEYADISGQVFLVSKEYNAQGVQVGTVITPKEKL